MKIDKKIRVCISLYYFSFINISNLFYTPICPFLKFEWNYIERPFDLLFPLMESLLAGLVRVFIGSKRAALITTYNVRISTILSLIVFYQVAICGSNYMIDWRPVIENSLVASLNDVITLEAVKLVDFI